MKRIKVIHILTDSNIGGAGRLLYNLSSCIDKKRFEFVFVFSKGSKLISAFKPLKAKIYTINGGADRSFDPKCVMEIKKVIKRESPHIVHTHSSLSGRIAARISGIPSKRIIYTRHCVFGVPKYMNNPLAKAVYGLVDDMLSSNALAVADAARTELVNFGVRASKIHIVINGSHPVKVLSDEEKDLVREELGIKKGEFVVGISARLEKYKGHMYFIKAAATAHKNEQNMKFIIMGEGAYRQKLEYYAKNIGVFNKNVRFLGFIDDVSRYMNIFDVNVNCSIGTETSSLSISEGLSLGIPAIVSDFGGNPNMVKNGITGYVVKKADPMALYEAILKIKNDRVLYKKMKDEAKKDFYDRFSDKRMTREYEEIYIKIMGKKQSID